MHLILKFIHDNTMQVKLCCWVHFNKSLLLKYNTLLEETLTKIEVFLIPCLYYTLVWVTDSLRYLPFQQTILQSNSLPFAKSDSGGRTFSIAGILRPRKNSFFHKQKYDYQQNLGIREEAPHFSKIKFKIRRLNKGPI